MENVINGKKANKGIISDIKKRIKRLFETAKPLSELENAEEMVDKIDDENYVKKEDKEEYDILKTLLQYLEFEKEKAEDVYEFRRVYYTPQDSYTPQETTIYITKKNAFKLSEHAAKYAEILGDIRTFIEPEKLNIFFPTELLFLKYSNQNMSYLEYQAPEPKLVSETEEEYEERLRSFYEAHGVAEGYDEEIFEEDSEFEVLHDSFHQEEEHTPWEDFTDDSFVNGKELNKQIIEDIKKRIKRLFEDGEIYSYLNDAEEIVDKIDDENYVKKEDREQYDILKTLLQHLEFEREKAEDVYEFRRVYYTSQDSYTLQETTIYITKENALKLSEHAAKYAEILGNFRDIETFIEPEYIFFPIELLFLKYSNQNMSYLEYQAPEPKLVSETEEEYEERLRSFYEAHGVAEGYDEEIFEEDSEFEVLHDSFHQEEEHTPWEDFTDDSFVNGKELNKQIIEDIKKRIKRLFETAKPLAELENAEESVDKIDDENYVKKEDKEEYDILMTLLQYLEFEKEKDEDVYEFKGVEYKTESDSKKTTIYVKKENAITLSKLATKYEDVLRRSNSKPDDKKMSIKFPIELLSLKYSDQNMPGLDYKAPEPKLASQSNQDYEDGLNTYYESHGITREADEVTEFRKPYPHEKINYRKDTPEITNVATNGYYSSIVEELAARDLGGEHGEPGLDPGEEEPIIGTDLPLGRRIGETYLNLRNILRSKTFHSKMVKGLAIVGLGAGAILCLKASPIITLMFAAGIGGGALGIKYVLPPVQKGYNAIKKKLKEWLFGPQLTETPEPTPSPREAEEEELEDPVTSMTSEEINTRIEEINAEATILEQKIHDLTEEIKGMDDTDPEKANKQSELAAKRQELRVKYSEISSLLHAHDEEHSMGGPRR